jgi:hypothetical protein
MTDTTSKNAKKCVTTCIRRMRIKTRVVGEMLGAAGGAVPLWRMLGVRQEAVANAPLTAIAPVENPAKTVCARSSMKK